MHQSLFSGAFLMRNMRGVFMIKISNLYKSFEDIDVLKDITFSIEEGSIIGIIGHSGAGKSTLLRCINGLETFEVGTVTVMEKDIKSLNSKEIRDLRKNLGMIFQNFNLLSRKTVFDNVALPLETWKYPKSKINERVNYLLEVVGIADKKDVKPNSLSGGQKQRVAIARALALEPKILLCDEATSALDPKTTKDILGLLKKINETFGITIVMVTHQMEVIKEICDNVVLLEHGESLYCGKVEDLFLKPNGNLKKFLGDEEDVTLDGINIKIFFPKDVSKTSVITSMARKLNIDVSIVGGKLEKFKDNILGTLTINVCESHKDAIFKYLEEKNVKWEVC